MIIHRLNAAGRGRFQHDTTLVCLGKIHLQCAEVSFGRRYPHVACTWLTGHRAKYLRHAAPAKRSATHEWPDRRLKRTDLTASDSHPLPAELPYDEAVETLVVGAAIIPQEPERLLLADEQAAQTVGAVMDASSIAAKRD